ncbi:hypothetical protein GALL_459890 [mine drainage metagenome]|uniref:Uncharacterized protein n=1 Tax=mine drainage metagenome TaxID=410659 RepID=A0A1J5PNL0_9ZZZZ
MTAGTLNDTGAVGEDGTPPDDGKVSEVIGAGLPPLVATEVPLAVA